MFKDEATKDDIAKYAKEVMDRGGEVVHHFESFIKGYIAIMSPAYADSLTSNLQETPIKYIEKDSILWTQPVLKETVRHSKDHKLIDETPDHEDDDDDDDVTTQHKSETVTDLSDPEKGNIISTTVQGDVDVDEFDEEH